MWIICNQNTCSRFDIHLRLDSGSQNKPQNVGGDLSDREREKERVCQTREEKWRRVVAYWQIKEKNSGKYETFIQWP